MKTVFETEVCSRCGGTGHYSFNGEHSICYKCDGKKIALTKRGQAARQYYLDKRTITPEQVKVGDVISFYGMKRLTVAKITLKQSGTAINQKGEATPIEHYYFENKDGLTGAVQKLKEYNKGGIWDIRLLLSPEENEKLLKEALAYQETLTKQGKPRKR